jgi:hypothetical protein
MAAEEEKVMGRRARNIPAGTLTLARGRLSLCIYIATAALCVGASVGSAGAIGLKAPTDSLPKDSPCSAIPKDVYADLKEALKKVLDSNVVGAINKQIEQEKGKRPNIAAKDVGVEIVMVSSPDELLKTYNADQADGNQWKADIAKDKFSTLNGFTYWGSKAEPRSIKIVLFCKDSLKTAIQDNMAARILVHELVHAKLFAMENIMGMAELGCDARANGDFKKKEEEKDRRGSHGDEHNEGFSKHVDELMPLVK